MSGKGSALLGWVTVGGGILLAYSAYKNKSPLDLLGNTLRGTAGTKLLSEPPVGAGPATVYSSSGTRPALLAARKIQPTYVPIPYQPTMLVDVCVIGPLMASVTEYGRPILLTGAKRTAEEQADGYAKDPSRFATPGNSLHEVGLAIDVSTILMDVTDPKLFNVLTRHGFYRRGKVLANGLPEPWHYSYGVPG